MTRPATALNLLYPLSEFLPQVVGTMLHLPGGQGMPQPARRLLVHDQDMTSTLETHHGERLALRLLSSRHSEGALWRQVLLVGQTSGRVHEAGAIRIELSHLDTAARWEVLEGRKPLGAILADHRVGYVSQPRLYFSFEAAESVVRRLGLEASVGPLPAAPTCTLFGRQNVLSTPGGELAEVVEILPPTFESGADGADPPPATG